MKLFNPRLLLVLLMTIMVYSCNSDKELVLLQNMGEEEINKGTQFSISDYKLQENDNLYVQVASLDPEVNSLFNPSMGSGSYSKGTSQQYGSQTAQYINGYQVEPDGAIDLPIIGKVQVAGKTIDEAKEQIVGKVNEYFKEATVSLKLLSFKYTVMGEVSNPGVYYNYDNTCTLLQAISQASGTTNYARPKKVLVLRETPNGTRSIRLDLTDKSILYSDAYYLKPNDVIYVSPDKFKKTRLNASMYSLMLSMLSILIALLK